jgi:CRP-like cAMP-binding protein
MTSHPFKNFMVRYGAGERIFSEGDLGTTMYIVQAGKVRLFRMAEGQKRVTGYMEKGDFFGEMSILEGLPRTLCAEAVEDTELIEINGMTFDKMIKANIEIAIRMLRKLSIRLRDTEQRLESLQAGDARPTAVARPTSAPRPQAASSAVSGARLEVEGENVVFALAGSETLVGRYDPVTDSRPHVDLTQVDLKRSVSRQHARIQKTGEEYLVVEEVGALNGTCVNGTKLLTGRPHPLTDGDRLSFGMVKVVFRR